MKLYTVAMGLKVYKQKRDFKKTSEPRAKTKFGAGQAFPIFVVQKHRARQLHYDFRLEYRGVLKSWAVPKGPPRRAGDRHLAVMVEDHPFAYKDFQGRIPKGEYGAGTVEIWDKGTYEPVKPVGTGIKNGHLTFILRGKKLKGEYALVSLRGSKKDWLMLKANKKV